jgi:hypothetical protein
MGDEILKTVRKQDPLRPGLADHSCNSSVRWWTGRHCPPSRPNGSRSWAT